MKETVLARKGGEVFKMMVEESGEWRLLEKSEATGVIQRVDDEAVDLMVPRQFVRSQGSINITSIYDTRTKDIENFLVARGDLWRAEVSHGVSSSGNENSPLFLIQLGPLLFVRDTTLMLPVHLSKQHLLWYGYDRKVVDMILEELNGEFPKIISVGKQRLLYSLLDAMQTLTSQSAVLGISCRLVRSPQSLLLNLFFICRRCLVSFIMDMLHSAFRRESKLVIVRQERRICLV